MKVKWSDALKPDGRFSRNQFALCYFLLPIIIFITYYVLGVVVGILGIPPIIILVPCLLFSAYVVTIAGIRRLHDLNRSGWQIILAFVPGANIVMIIILFFSPGIVEGNRWLKTSELEE